MSDIPVQLRLGFGMPGKSQRWLISLSGLQVRAEPTDRDHSLMCSYLAALGVPFQTDAGGGVAFPVQELPRITEAPESVDVVPDSTVSALWQLLNHPPDKNFPVVLEKEDSSYVLCWHSEGVDLAEPAHSAAAVALLRLPLPVIASDRTWEDLLRETSLPVVIGRVRTNLDGFLEIAASMPQRIEASNIPALFRLDDTHFGVPLAYAEALDKIPGLVWASRRPVPPTRRQLRPVPIPLSDHARSDLDDLAGSLDRLKSRAVAWSSGLGRRVFCLAAVESLDAYPLLIIAHPHAVWAWQRHADMMDRSTSLTHDRADIRIVTYHDVMARRALPSPSALILDSLDTVAANPDALESLRSLDGLVDTIRIGCMSDFPSAPEDVVAIMSLLRPLEFNPRVPVPLRYPVQPEVRLAEHAAVYLSHRQSGSPMSFRRSRVETIEMPEALRDAIMETYASTYDDVDLLAELMRLSSCGDTRLVSPKVARAVELAQVSLKAGDSVAIATRHDRSRHLLTSLLAASNSAGGPRADVAMFAESMPDLRDYDHVIFLDYPWSTSSIDQAVGTPQEERGPRTVTVLHLVDSIDDRLAMFAARRRERDVAVERTAPPSEQDLGYLLTLRRWARKP